MDIDRGEMNKFQETKIFKSILSPTGNDIFHLFWILQAALSSQCGGTRDGNDYSFSRAG